MKSITLNPAPKGGVILGLAFKIRVYVILCAAAAIGTAQDSAEQNVASAAVEPSYAKLRPEPPPGRAGRQDRARDQSGDLLRAALSYQPSALSPARHGS